VPCNIENAVSLFGFFGLEKKLFSTFQALQQGGSRIRMPDQGLVGWLLLEARKKKKRTSSIFHLMKLF
jgi:hypothetical protein